VSAVTIFDHVIGNTRYVLREITIAPGGSTGWHYHPGPVFGLVKKGVLHHNMADCSSHGVFGPGQTISEPSGAEHVHIGRNLGTTPVVLDALYKAPVDSPLAVSASNPGCVFE
jgi:quercetin dioxygenase-like cupin family protein